MFGTITGKRLKILREITDNLHNITIEEIENSKLPVFNKNFILEESKSLSDKTELDKALEKSVKLNINYAVRPKWTLLNYLYGGYESKSADELIRKAGIFQFYKYYTDVISKFVKTNPLIFIPSSRVQELIDETNLFLYEKLITNISGIKVKNFFLQIFKLKYGDDREITLEDSVPFAFIRLFLEDKKFIEFLGKFKIVGHIDDNDEIELKTLIKVLTNKYDTDADTVKLVKDENKNNIDFGNKAKEKKDILIVDNIKTEKDYRKIKIENDVETKKISSGNKKDITSEIDNEKDTENLSDIYSNAKNDVTDTESKKIKRIFKEGELNIIAKKIFRSSRLSMFLAFEEMEKLKNWNEAVYYLKDIFKNNKVDMYNKNVVLFIDLMNDYFVNKEKGYL